MELIKTIFIFIKEWANLGLIIVGSFALVVYYLQERRKKTEAAALIILQIDELQNKLRDMYCFISYDSMDTKNFYESLMLLENNYWDKYKHYFVKKIDRTSYNKIDTFYSYVSAINQQQRIIKDLQTDSFYKIRDIIQNVESQCMFNGIIQYSNEEELLHSYRKQQQIIKYIIEQASPNMAYIPKQTQLTLEKVFKQYSLLEISGTEGYRKLKKFADRKF